jgi:hypothetical protein
MWLRFAVLWVTVVLIGFVEGYVLIPLGLAAFLGSVFLTALVVWRVVPVLALRAATTRVLYSNSKFRPQSVSS